MKKSALLVLLFSTITATAATWTVHAYRDNYTYAQVIGPCIEWPDGTATRSWTYYPQWDLAWDELYPESADSGLELWGWNGPWPGGDYQTTQTAGYLDTWVLADAENFVGPATLTEFGMEIWVMVSGPAPDYGNYWNNWANIPITMAGGEWWFDFAVDGAARISATQPSDFGKWAWDGSINPSWVEPLTAKKQHSKGHGK